MPNFPFITDTGFTSNTLPVSVGYSYDFDDLPTDGVTTTFALTYNLELVTSVTDPKHILVSINGAIQPSFDYRYHYSWGVGILPVYGAMVGYTVIDPGYISFAQAPPRGAQIVIKPIMGNLQPKQKTYPFRALDIALGP